MTLNGTLIKTEDRCDKCSGRSEVTDRPRENKVHALWAFNGEKICLACAKKIRLL